MKKAIAINSADCSAFFSKYGYSVSYKKVYGSAGGTMLDGSTIEDIIAVKAVITLNFLPQTEEELNEFISMLYSEDYATVTYFDPRAGEERTIETIYSELEAKHRMTNFNEDEIWTLNTLVLTER